MRLGLLLILALFALDVSGSASEEIVFTVDLDVDSSSILLQPSDVYSVVQDNPLIVPVTIYRGATLKRTVYVWIEDRAGKRISDRHKFSLGARFTEYTVVAHLNITGCQHSGEYFVMAEGLDVESSASTVLELGCTTDIEGDTMVEEVELALGKASITYDVLSWPDEVYVGVPFYCTVVIRNPTDDYLDVDVWSYVYRSSRCVSGEREENQVTVNVPEHANITLDLHNTVEAEPGEYGLMFRFQRSDRKTPDELKKVLNVIDGAGGNAELFAEGMSVQDVLEVAKVTSQQPVQGEGMMDASRVITPAVPSGDQAFSKTVFESSSARARRYAGYILILVLFLVLVALVLKRL